MKKEKEMSGPKIPYRLVRFTGTRLIEQYESMSEEVEGAEGESATPKTT
jgi:hypothetical protein